MRRVLSSADATLVAIAATPRAVGQEEAILLFALEAGGDP